MSSRRSFIPGSKQNATRKLINYGGTFNQLNINNINPFDDTYQCICAPTIYNKSVLGSDSPSTRVSYNTRISQVINFYKGGKTQYGNFYLGQPLQLNYLGRSEGMPGGSGMPPLNQFN